MPLLPLSQASTTAFKSVRLIATDMDGTLTTAGRFTPELLQTFKQLAAVDIQVLILTGRSAGWVSGLAHYLPVWGAIAENGGLLYVEGAYPATLAQTLLVPLSDLVQHRQQLADLFQRLQVMFPALAESSDNCFRLTDWTFDVQGLSTNKLEEIDRCCQRLGWGFTYSTIQCHLKLRSQDKATGLQTVLQKYFPDYTAENVLTVGDSPNDESLFDASRFPLSVGVANVLDYSDRLLHLPAYVTTAAEGDGFLELAHLLLRARQA